MQRVISAARRLPFLGPALRRWVRRYPEGSVVNIRSGAARGLRWRRYQRYATSYWLGTYEPEIQRLFAETLRPGHTVFDVGANAGFFTVLAARAVGESGRVVALEPQPDNAACIAAQVDVNGFRNVEVVAKAVAASRGTVRFAAGPNLAQGHVVDAAAAAETAEVEAVALDDLLDPERPPDFVKVDIEGGGIELVKGARAFAAAGRPVWMLEVHGTEEGDAFKDLLAPLGYRFRALEGRAIPPEECLLHHSIAFPQ